MVSEREYGQVNVMRKLVVLTLQVVLLFGIFAGLNVTSSNPSGSVQTQSSTYQSHFIDHLPFIINQTGVYYVTKDLHVNEPLIGITIKADGVVLLGEGHTITGDGTGGYRSIGVYVFDHNYTVIKNLGLTNFYRGIFLESTPVGLCGTITNNIVCGNYYGILLGTGDIGNCNVTVCRNMIFNNSGYGIIDYGCGNSYIFDNFLNNTNNALDIDTSNFWNITSRSGPNIIGGPSVGGNYWTNPTGNGYSDTCNDSDKDGFGDVPYSIPAEYNGSADVDYLPLVAANPPKYDFMPLYYALPNVALNITWRDNARVNETLLEFDGVNYTDAVKTGGSIGFNENYEVEQTANYSRSFQNLALGPHSYRWYAKVNNDLWNSTPLQSFNVINTPIINSVSNSPILKVSANITSQGMNNVTEALDYVQLRYKTDDGWFSMNMTYNPYTSLYEASTPVYNQLANETIQFYVTAKTKLNQFLSSKVYSYYVPDWIKGDLNRDGRISIDDINPIAWYWGKHT
jgi:hypothetical protein